MADKSKIQVEIETIAKDTGKVSQEINKVFENLDIIAKKAAGNLNVNFTNSINNIKTNIDSLQQKLSGVTGKFNSVEGWFNPGTKQGITNSLGKALEDISSINAALVVTKNLLAEVNAIPARKGLVAANMLAIGDVSSADAARLASSQKISSMSEGAFYQSYVVDKSKADWDKYQQRLKLEEEGNKKLIEQQKQLQSTPQGIFSTKLAGATQRIDEAKAMLKVTNDWIVANKQLASKELLTWAEGFGNSLRLTAAGLESGKVSIRNFAASLGMLKTEMKDLIFWQARWYGTKMLIFTPLQMMSTAIKDNLELGKAVQHAGAAADMSSEQMEDLRKESIAISNVVPIAAKKIAESSLEFAQAGMPIDAIREALPRAAKMVVTTNEDMKHAVTALTVSFFAWKLNAADIPVVADKISAAMVSSRLKVEDLATVFNYLATTARNLNLNIKNLTSIEDVLTLSAVLSQAGVKASTIGTGLGNAITRLVAPSSRLKEALKSALIDYKDVDPTKNRLLDIFKNLATAPELTLKEIFEGWELRGGRAIAAIVNQGANALDDMAAKVEEKGVLEKLFAKSTNNVLDQLEVLKNKTINLFSINKEQENVFVGIVKSLQILIEFIEKFKSELILLFSIIIGTKALDILVKSFALIEEYLISILIKLGLTEKALLALKGLTIPITIAIGVLWVLNKTVNEIMEKEKVKLDEFIKSLSDDKVSILEKIVGKKNWRKLVARPIGLTPNEKELLNSYVDAGGMRVPDEIALGFMKKRLGTSDETYYNYPGVNKPDKEKTGKGIKNIYGKEASDIDKKYNIEIQKIKDGEAEKLNIEENYNKLGLTFFEENIRRKLEISINANNAEIEQLNKKSIEEDISYEKGKKRINDEETDAEKRTDLLNNLERDHKNRQEDIGRRITQVNLEQDKNIRNSGTETTLHIREEINKRLQYAIEYNKKEIQNVFDNKSKIIEMEKKSMDWLYSKKMVSERAYADWEKNTILNEKERRLSKNEMDLGEQANLFFANAKPETVEETFNVWLSAYQEYKNNILTIETETNAQLEDLTRTHAERIELLYSNGKFTGVLKKVADDLRVKYSDTGQQIYDVINNSFTAAENSVTDFLDYTSAKFMDWKTAILDILHSIYMEMLKTFLMKQIMGGIMGSVSSFLGIGGGGGSVEMSSVSSNLYATAFGRAGGGYVGLNKMYLVGENGPELFTPNTNGTIIPNNQLGSTPNIEVNVVNNTGIPFKTTDSPWQMDKKKMVKNIIFDLMSTDVSFRSTMRGK